MCLGFDFQDLFLKNQFQKNEVNLLKEQTFKCLINNILCFQQKPKSKINQLKTQKKLKIL